MHKSLWKRAWLGPPMLGEPPCADCRPHDDAVTVLLFEFDAQVRATRALLLERAQVRVVRASSYLEVLRLEGYEPALVMLSLHPVELEAVRIATFARRQWPHARVLVLGSPSQGFDDWLYDDSLAYGWTPAKLLDTVSRLLSAHETAKVFSFKKEWL